ncbi:MAG TPA: alpha/beta hydrolase [Myxococcaceae bacterium]|nr:alpha/beta hydrolase [Myxococcaceae bacterium]
MVLLLALLGAYLGLCAVLFLVQRALVFPAPRDRVDAESGTTVEVPGGTPMLWRFVEGGGPVVVHFHGNGEQIGGLGWLGEALAKRQVSFAAVEYPGYPGAPGTPSEASIVAAAEKALEHLTGRMGVARERIVLSGQSLGTGVAVRLAANGWGTKLVLLSPYTSMPDVATRGVFQVFPVRLLMRDRFDSESLAPRIDRPVLMLHGSQDEIVPFDLGQALSARFPHARFVEVQGAGHNDLWQHPPTASEYLDFVAR